MFAAFNICIYSLPGIARMRQVFLYDKQDIYMWILIIVAVLVLGVAFGPWIYRRLPRWTAWITAALIGLFVRFITKKKTGDDESSLEEAIEAAGYAYEPIQDIFYSTLDAWQRNMGYCRLYDEAAAPMGMIIDCEPIYFEYDKRRWLIEFWKGQYDLTTGAEIGVYVTDEPDIDVPGVFEGPFFKCASNEELLHIAYLVKKNGKVLFRREDTHWWLTGFKLGEFSEPSELTLYLTVELKNEEMRDAFVGGLKNAGYIKGEIIIRGNTVGLVFDKPKTEQPTTRTEDTDFIIQRKNQVMCEMYQEITGPYNTFPEKLKAVQEQSPELVEAILNIGKTQRLFDNFNKIKDQLSK